MGLFDRVKLDDRLNLKLKKADAATINNVSAGNNKWKQDMQTKDLENWMQDYTIDSKGKLWIYEDPRDKRKRKKFTHTGLIDVYTIITNDETDYDADVNVSIKFDNGIGKVVSTKVTKSSNATRIKNENIFEENRKKYDAMRRKTWFKVYRNIYKRPVSWSINKTSHALYALSMGVQRLRFILLPW